jgi:hypothetical protein
MLVLLRARLRALLQTLMLTLMVEEELVSNIDDACMKVLVNLSRRFEKDWLPKLIWAARGLPQQLLPAQVLR